MVEKSTQTENEVEPSFLKVGAPSVIKQHTPSHFGFSASQFQNMEYVETTMKKGHGSEFTENSRNIASIDNPSKTAEPSRVQFYISNYEKPDLLPITTTFKSQDENQEIKDETKSPLILNLSSLPVDQPYVEALR